MEDVCKLAFIHGPTLLLTYVLKTFFAGTFTPGYYFSVLGSQPLCILGPMGLIYHLIL